MKGHCGRRMKISKEDPILGLRTCDYVDIHGKWDVAGVIKDPKMGR